jgi:hypothetical protein
MQGKVIAHERMSSELIVLQNCASRIAPQNCTSKKCYMQGKVIAHEHMSREWIVLQNCASRIAPQNCTLKKELHARQGHCT